MAIIHYLRGPINVFNPNFKMNEICPCGSGLYYADCCGAIIEGQRAAKTAEELMRSRYTAFTQANAEYLMKSWHPSTRNMDEKQEIRNWAKSVKWVKLKITETRDGQPDDQTGMVSFSAFFREKGKLKHITEDSAFEKINNEWFYLSGIHH